MEALAPVMAQLGIDQSFFYLFAMVFVLYAIMGTAYLRPFQRLLHERRARTEGAKKQAEELKIKADQAFEQYKIRLKDVNDSARRALRDAEEVAKKEEARIIGAASTKAKASLQNAQKDLDEQKNATVMALASEITSIAEGIATKVLGRPAGNR